MKYIQFGKEEIKLALVIMTQSSIYTKTLGTNTYLRESAGYRVNIQNSVVFLCAKNEQVDFKIKNTNHLY